MKEKGRPPPPIVRHKRTLYKDDSHYPSKTTSRRTLQQLWNMIMIALELPVCQSTLCIFLEAPWTTKEARSGVHRVAELDTAKGSSCTMAFLTWVPPGKLSIHMTLLSCSFIVFMAPFDRLELPNVDLGVSHGYTLFSFQSTWWAMLAHDRWSIIHLAPSRIGWIWVDLMQQVLDTVFSLSTKIVQPF